MWAEIKKTLNSTLGRKDFHSLDIQNDINAYWSFYMFARVLYETAEYRGYSVKVGFKTLTQTSSNRSKYTMIFYPWLEEIGDDCEIYSPLVILPPSLIKIGKNAFLNDYDYNPLNFNIPYSVKEINLEAFAKLKTGDKVIINNKRGAISGHPWGHPDGDDGIIYTYE